MVSSNNSSSVATEEPVTNFILTEKGNKNVPHNDRVTAQDERRYEDQPKVQPEQAEKDTSQSRQEESETVQAQHEQEEYEESSRKQVEDVTAKQQPVQEEGPAEKRSNSSDNGFANRSSPINEAAVDEDDNKSEFLFKKKDVKKPRAQSIQSVLSTASLKSLKHQYINNPPNFSRNASIVSNGDGIRNIQPGGALTNNNNNSTNNLISSMKNSKNFQSFIQAPVLSSISNLKNDNIEIGQQLPFNDNGNRLDSSKSTDSQTQTQTNVNETNSDDYYDDHDTILQQQKLTINALKKLSLSPMPIINQETRKPAEKKATTQEQRPEAPTRKSSQPYQPAEVDLSSFASLTRQKGSNLSINTENLNLTSNPPSASSNIRSATDTLPGANLIGSMSSTASNSMNLALNKNAPPPSPSSASKTTSLNQRQNSNTPKRNQPSAVLQEAHDQATINYHNEVRQNHINNFRPLLSGKHSAAVVPPSDMNPRQQQHPQPLLDSRDKHLQQIKGFRNPMYIPAVLRLTQNQIDAPHPESSLPENYPSGNGEEANLGNRETRSSSRDSLRSIESNKSNESMPSSPLVSPPLVTTGPYKLYNKRKYDEISRSAPTRKHWLKDESVVKCGIASCPKYFNFFERRHHCRKCGGIYCKEHTSHNLYINHLAQFTTGGRGTLSKVCDYCIAEYNEFMKQEFGVDLNSSSHDLHKETFSAEDYVEPEVKKDVEPTNGDRLTKLPVRSNMNLHSEIKSGSNITDNKSEQLVGSVPANWSWSSF